MGGIGFVFQSIEKVNEGLSRRIRHHHSIHYPDGVGGGRRLIEKIENEFVFQQPNRIFIKNCAMETLSSKKPLSQMVFSLPGTYFVRKVGYMILCFAILGSIKALWLFLDTLNSHATIKFESYSAVGVAYMCIESI
jgi:hypothetical protein